MSGSKTYYRSLEHLEHLETGEHADQFRDLLRREFPDADPETLPEVSRRRFMQLLGASAGLAAASAGCRWEEERILTENQRERVPGVPRQFATAFDLAGVALPLVVKSFDGRPIKIEGNALHPASQGATNHFAQAALLGLYDPDRSRHPVTGKGAAGAAATLDDFLAWLRPHLQALRGQGGAGLAVLAEQSGSDTQRELRARLARALPQARYHEWEPLSRDEEREGTKLAFGRPHRPLFALADADVIVALDCDFLSMHPDALRLTREFAARRVPAGGAMNRLYVVEADLTTTGSNADHRLPLRQGLIGAVVAALEAELGVEGAAPAPALMDNERAARFVRAVAADLKRHAGRSLLAIGAHQPAAVQARVHRLNEKLGNLGRTVAYAADPDPARPRHVDDLRALAADMAAGRVDTLIVLGANPVHTAPADLDFAAALEKVPNSVHLGLYRDETGERCQWHVNQAHFLESWGDARSWDGSYSIVQPLIAPLFAGTTALELLAVVAGDELSNGFDLVQRTFEGLGGGQHAGGAFDQAWAHALHDGLVAGSAFARATPAVAAVPALPEAGDVADQPANGALELVFRPDPKLFDGRFANNGWLQELPDFVTKLTWDNVALLGPATAKALGVKTGKLIELSAGGRTLEIAALIVPGIAPGSVVTWLGHGRTAAGGVGGSAVQDVAPVGFDTYRLRTADAPFAMAGLTVQRRGGDHPLALTQEHWGMDTVGQEGIEERLGRLVREADLDEYRKNPDFVREGDHGPPLISLWEEHEYEGPHRWGMAIDLGRCTGCNACVVACQAENNIPVVGKERVLRGREMHWIRIDRYFAGDPEDPSISTQPLPCQQCENAPCESVCPVGATMHSEEGLNDMVYNRCVGTRYCSNNCPYKVRRFNFFNYQLHLKDPEREVLKMMFNPEVTVRARGVMEKCTYCVQRISVTRIQAKNEQRAIRDGEITPACAQTCPAQAITFGDLNDRASRVAVDHGDSRAYSLLYEKNTKPRTAYLGRVRNPNPDLVS